MNLRYPIWTSGAWSWLVRHDCSCDFFRFDSTLCSRTPLKFSITSFHLFLCIAHWVQWYFASMRCGDHREGFGVWDWYLWLFEGFSLMTRSFPFYSPRDWPCGLRLTLSRFPARHQCDLQASFDGITYTRQVTLLSDIRATINPCQHDVTNLHHFELITDHSMTWQPFVEKKQRLFNLVWSWDAVNFMPTWTTILCDR